MALIDPDGMFGGDRMALLSDTARLHWPWMWCASNTVARLELDYQKVMARAYRQFAARPSEDEFWVLIGEYQKAYLLYIYEQDGQIWGQWDTSEKYLQRHKLTADIRSPAPTVREFADFKNHYIEDKKDRASRKFSIINKFGNPARPREDPHGGVLGVGVGVGVGVGEGGGEGKSNPCATDVALVGTVPPKQREKRKSPLTPQQQIWFANWWDSYWLKKSVGDAEVAFGRHVQTQERFDEVMAKTKALTPEMMQREPHKRPYGATWLNAKGWDDEVSVGGGYGNGKVPVTDQVKQLAMQRIQRDGQL